MTPTPPAEYSAAGGISIIVNMTLEVLEKSGFVALVAGANDNEKICCCHSGVLFTSVYKHSEVVLNYATLLVLSSNPT